MIKYFVQQPTDKSFQNTFARKTAGAAGFDLHALIGTPRELPVGGRFVFSTGIYVAMPIGCEAQVRPRSGLVRDHGVAPIGPGTVDSDYRGEVKITIFNFGDQLYTVNPGDRIGQLVFAPVLPRTNVGMAMGKPTLYNLEPLTAYDVEMLEVKSVEDLGTTVRGDSGYGSTGR